MPFPAALAFLANPSFWAGVAKFIPTAANIALSATNKNKESESDASNISNAGISDSGGNPIIQQPFQMAQGPQQLFQYEPRHISSALQEMLKKSRGF